MNHHRQHKLPLALDIGKVLVLFDHTICCKKLETSSPYTSDEIFDRFYLSEIATKLEKGMISKAEFFETVKKKLELDLNFAQFNSAFSDIFTLNEPMFEFLKDNQDHFDYWIISNTNTLHLDFLMYAFPELFNLFKGYTLSFEVGAMKPDPEIFESFLEKSGWGGREPLFFDDIEENVAGAKQSHIDAHLYSLDRHDEFVSIAIGKLQKK